VPQAHRNSAPPPVIDKPIYLGDTPRRRVRKPAHERKRFEYAEAAEPDMAACGIYVIGFLFILFVVVFILLRTSGVM